MLNVVDKILVALVPLAAEQEGPRAQIPNQEVGGTMQFGPPTLTVLQWIVTKHSIFGIAIILFKLHEIW